MAGNVTIRVQADPAEEPEWAAFARRVEELGFEGLVVADHPGSGSAPFVALAAAAAVKDRLQLGSYVASAGAWQPIALASQTATLDVLSAGRAVLGVGAGQPLPSGPCVASPTRARRSASTAWSSSSTRPGLCC